MLGFRPFSTNPISDIQLPVITGTISVTDTDDTASLTGTVVSAGTVSGSINTTDTNDTASLSGTVTGVAGTISTTDNNDTASLSGNVITNSTGTISATDDNDTASISGQVGATGHVGGDDGFTKEEYKRLKKIQAKKRKAEQERLDAYRKAQADRKSAIKELVDPSPKSKEKQNKVQSNQEVSEDIPSEITALDNTIANLVRQEQELLQGVMLRQELVRIQTEMAILEAKRLQELDDEEAILLLL